MPDTGWGDAALVLLLAVGANTVSGIRCCGMRISGDAFSTSPLLLEFDYRGVDSGYTPSPTRLIAVLVLSGSYITAVALNYESPFGQRDFKHGVNGRPTMNWPGTG